MPISATGRTDESSATGFSLIEVIVVVAVIGLASGAVMVAMPGDAAALRPEAERLAARLAHAAHSSILDGVAYGAKVDTQGYSFFRIRDEAWAVIANAPPLVQERWNNKTTASVIADADTISTDPASPAPNVVFDPTGVATPFRVIMRHSAAAFVVEGDAFGKIKVGADDSAH